MPERYDTITARHYAAYRPPLHEAILERLADPSERFASGLDFGCGAGQSTIALAQYCDRICGVDLNTTMLDQAKPHPNVTYKRATVETLDQCPGQPYDVVTFAGSLFYAKSDELRTALNGVCAPSATILVYDFKIHLDPFLESVALPVSSGLSNYDYDINLSDWSGYETTIQGAERLSISATAQEMAHLLLSDSFYCDALAERFGADDPFDPIVSHIQERDPKNTLVVDIWYKRYRSVATD